MCEDRKAYARPMIIPVGNGCNMCDGKGNESVHIGFCEDARKEPTWNNGWVIQQCAACRGDYGRHIE